MILGEVVEVCNFIFFPLANDLLKNLASYIPVDNPQLAWSQFIWKGTKLSLVFKQLPYVILTDSGRHFNGPFLIDGSSRPISAP